MEGLAYLFLADKPKPDAELLSAVHANFAITCIMLVVGVVALACLVRWARHAKLRISTIAWGLVFVAALVGLRQLCDLKMLYCPAEVYGACCVMAVVGGIACALRDLLFDILEAGEKRGQRAGGEIARATRDALALLGSAVMCTVAIEIPWNENVLPANPTGVIVEMLVILAVLVVLYFASMRHGIGPLVGIVACLALGEAQYFVTQFRGSPLMPSDLMALETAAAVSGGYSYELRMGAVWAIAWALGAACLMVFVQPHRLKGKKHLVRVGASLACALAVGLGIFACARAIDFSKDLGFKQDNWHPFALYESYCKNGFMPVFLATAQRMNVTAPQGFTREKAADEQARLAEEGRSLLEQDQGYQLASRQFERETPHVVVVMNESFSDLSIFEGLHAGYEGPEFFKQRFANTLAKGPLSVSVIGGGTANSEFEFLASTTLSSVGHGVTPYSMFRLNDVRTLVDTFKEMGYDATAIHPGEAGNWHRDQVYPALGFDEFIDVNSFDGAPDIRNFATDASTYDAVLEVIEDASSPQFIFDVTIQNHGGYPVGSVPPELLVNYPIDDDGLERLGGELNQYLSLMRSSDADLEEFIGKLSALGEKVVLVFFGDHQPGLSSGVNAAIFEEEDPHDLQHTQRMYESVYAVWANYPIAGREEGFAVGETRSSASNLANVALQAVGGPFDEAALAKLALRQQIPAANLFGYQGDDGQWYRWDDEASPYAHEAALLQDLEYLNFGWHVR